MGEQEQRGQSGQQGSPDTGPQDPVIVWHVSCEDDCGCGCENDGEWHYEGSAGCVCAKTGCPCVKDYPGYGIVDSIEQGRWAGRWAGRVTVIGEPIELWGPDHCPSCGYEPGSHEAECPDKGLIAP